MLTADPVYKPDTSTLILMFTVGLLGAGSQILRLLLRIPPHWQTITAFPIGLTEETLVSEPIFKALYDVTSLKPLDKASAKLAGMLFWVCIAVQGLKLHVHCAVMVDAFTNPTFNARSPPALDLLATSGSSV
jgi:hypothetical protein